MTTIITGIILGISIAAPVGPIGILCIRKTLTQGKAFGFVSGMGAATADAIYGSIAALGLTIISNFLIEQSTWINVAGATFLLYLAYSTFKAPVKDSVGIDRGKMDYFKTFGTTLLLTLMNPLTIISFVGIFAGMNLGSASQSPVQLVLGVFIGSAIWWLLLSTIVGSLKQMISFRMMKFINIISSLIILGFGILNIYKAMI
ncbi:MAG: LysE family transporter [Candidatus Cohnella colombiensis]|uniref:LysE family transporter n=1 Tax=Candidatus Cohnella colombiensis TaxID=3121368 RepID=A0AA95JEF0_9BACL|nr:MAG: LysE family transporter [Cohnella sp.]